MFWDARRFLFGAPEEGNISDNLPEHNGRRGRREVWVNTALSLAGIPG